MIDQNSITVLPFTLNSAGLTPTVKISKNGASLITPDGSVSEIGFGVYALTSTSGDTDTLGTLVLYGSASGSKPGYGFFRIIKAEEHSIDDVFDEAESAFNQATTNGDALNSISARLTSGQINIINPGALGSTIVLQAGDDYSNTDGRPALILTTETNGQWPDLTDATISWLLTHNEANRAEGVATLTKAGTITQATGDEKSVYVEMTAEDSASLAIGTAAYSYRLTATLEDEHVITLSTGTVNVRGN